MILKACKFKRTETSKWEPGITIEGMTSTHGILVDKKGRLVNKRPIYNIEDHSCDLSLDLSGVLEKIML